MMMFLKENKQEVALKTRRGTGRVSKGVLGIKVFRLPQSLEVSTNLAPHFTPIPLPVPLQVSSILFLFSFLKRRRG